MHTQTFTHTIAATAAGQQRRFVNYAGAPAIATDQVLGIAMTDFQPGQLLTAHILGVAAVEAGGAVAARQFVIPDAQGRAIADAASAPNRVGTALHAVTAAGQTLLILIK